MNTRKSISMAAVLLFSLMLAACGGAASGGAASSGGGASSGGAASAGGGAAAAAPRAVTISHVEGDVKYSATAAGSPAAAAADQAVVPGARLQTGADGHATLALEDGTRVELEANTSLDVTKLEGTPEVPVSHFTLNNGSAYVFHQGALPAGAAFDITTPAGTGSIQHSMMSIAFDKETGKIRLTCLEGACSLNRGDQSLNLNGGQAVDISGLGDKFDQSFVRNMSQEEIQAWINANLTCGCNIDIQPVIQAAETQAAEATAEATQDTSGGSGGEATAEATQDTSGGSGGEATSEPAPADQPQPTP
jgi:hypothetical protein